MSESTGMGNLGPGYGAVDTPNNNRDSVSNLSARSGEEDVRSTRNPLRNSVRNSMNPRGSRMVDPLRASRKSWAPGNIASRMSVTMPNAIPVHADEPDTPFQLIKRECHLIIGAGTSIFFLIWGDHHTLETLDAGLFAVMFTWIFCVILWHAFAVVRHADCLAVRLGEPYGTLILTISVISIEVIMMVALMFSADKPTNARDTMFSVIMIVINGMLGVTLILGGVRHSEQEYNFQSSQSFLNVITPLGVLSLIIPSYTKHTGGYGGQVSNFHAVFLIFTSIALYGTFLLVQTIKHPEFFMYSNKFGVPNYFSEDEQEDRDLGEGETDIMREVQKLKSDQGKLAQSVSNLTRQLAESPRASCEAVNPFEESEDEHAGLVIRSTRYHAALLLLSMVPVSLLAEKLAVLVEKLIKDLNAPDAMAGFLIAILVLSPEAMGAAKAALANKIQRTVNIALGMHREEEEQQ